MTQLVGLRMNLRRQIYELRLAARRRLLSFFAVLLSCLCCAVSAFTLSALTSVLFSIVISSRYTAPHDANCGTGAHRFNNIARLPHQFNPAGLRPKLSVEQQEDCGSVVKAGPDPDQHGVVRLHACTCRR